MSLKNKLDIRILKINDKFNLLKIFNKKYDFIFNEIKKL